MRRLFTGIFLIIPVLGFAQLPEWVTNPQDFENGKYLVAMGTGVSMEQATNAAFANMSMVFSVQVESTEQLNEWSSESGMNFQIESRYSRDSQLETKTELINAKILASYTDADLTVFILVGIDRNATASIIRQRGIQMEEDFNVIIGDKSSHKLKVISRLIRAEDLTADYNTLKSYYQVISTVGGGWMNMEAARLTMLDELRSATNYQIIEELEYSELNTAAHTILSIYAVQDRTNSDITTALRLDVDQDYEKTTTTYLRWYLEIEVEILVPGGRTVKGTYTKAGAESGNNERIAQNALRRAVLQTMEREFTVYLDELVESL